MKGGNGKLLRSPPGPKKSTTIPFWFEMPYQQLFTELKEDPMAFSVLLYDRSAWHYDALFRAPEIAPTELVDPADIGAMSDADDALAAEAAVD
eukprot:3404266-Prymnesium_polylepis.1